MRVVPLLAAALLVACGGDGAPRPAGDGAEDGYLVGAEDARLYYRVLGTGSDTVVVVHGGPGAGMNSILPVVAPLADRFVLIFYDQRGGGRSELPADTSLLQGRYFVEDLEAVRRHFGLERLKLVAHSFGSIIVASYAKAHPERVARMVFHGATGPRRAEAARIARATPPSSDSALSKRAARHLDSLLDGTAVDPVATCEAFEEAGRRLAEARGETTTWNGTTYAASPEAVRYYYRHTAQLGPVSFGDWDFPSGLEHVSAPLLVVYGARDSMALGGQRAWAAAVPHGRFLAVAGARKGAITDRPEVVFPAVASFLRGEWPAGAEVVRGDLYGTMP